MSKDYKFIAYKIDNNFQSINIINLINIIFKLQTLHDHRRDIN